MNIRITRDPWNVDGSFAVIFFEYDATTKKAFVMKPVEMEEVDVDGIITQPSFTLRQEDLAAIMDQLWLAGVRPLDWKKVDDSDIKKHLEDMRQLAFANLKIDKPEGQIN